MASSEYGAPQAAALLQQLQDLLEVEGFETDDGNVKAVKRKACVLAEKLWLDLLEPGDYIDRIIFQTQENALTRLAMDLNIYSMLVSNASPKGLSAAQIAAATNADKELVVRIMRCLGALNHVDEHLTQEKGKQNSIVVYTPNKVTRAWTTAKGISGLNFSFDCTTPAWNAMPTFFAANNYRNPTDSWRTPLQQAFNTEKHYFDLITERNLLPTFQTLMTAWRADRADFLDIYPAADRLVVDQDASKSFLVDVGGGHGHEIKKARQALPDIPAESFVLQDQKDILAEVKMAAGMQIMEHDFFTPQPVKGARCYYFRMIYHDWPDDKCVEILENTKSAMTPGYSRLIINEVVLPDSGATRFAAQMDFNMLSLFASSERSESQWRRLLEDKGGLKIIKFWPGVPESVIEAELPA